MSGDWFSKCYSTQWYLENIIFFSVAWLYPKVTWVWYKTLGLTAFCGRLYSQKVAQNTPASSKCSKHYRRWHSSGILTVLGISVAYYGKKEILSVCITAEEREENSLCLPWKLCFSEMSLQLAVIMCWDRVMKVVLQRRSERKVSRRGRGRTGGKIRSNDPCFCRCAVNAYSLCTSCLFHCGDVISTHSRVMW